MYSTNEMKRLLSFLIVFLTLLAAASQSCGKGAEFDRQMHNADSQERFSMGDSRAVPIAPETTQNLVRDSDIIVYAHIDNVENKIEKKIQAGPGFEGGEVFPEQRCTASFLWVLKGDMGLQNSTVPVIKEKSRYYISDNEKRVLYLKKDATFFRTVDGFGGEHRLASALCNIRNLDGNATSGGVVASFHQVNDESLHPIIHVLKGRLKASIERHDDEWGRHLLKTCKMGEFNISEIPLPEGVYTALMERNGELLSYTRLIDGYYACVFIGKHRWWEPLYFER